ncbi:MAG: EAL domain-containing protein [Bacillota bacterium]
MNKVTEVDLACIEQAVSLAPQDGLLFLNLQPSTAVWLAQHKERLADFESIVPKDRAVLEIIESENINKSIQTTLDSLKHLKGKGFTIAIDDVTSGYNRLHMVASLQPAYIKLDGPVIRGCHKSQSQRMTIEHLNKMGQEMGFQVIAENIETPAELETIINAGVSFGQGYYLGRPSFSYQNTYKKEGA